MFNEAAKTLLQPLGVKIIDLYSWVAEKCPVPYSYSCSIQSLKPGDPCQVHFNNDGGWQYVAIGYAAGVKKLIASSHPEADQKAGLATELRQR